MMQWATGLTITTTGLDKFDKEAIRQDVENAGGRYSPNLSKRTTNLVTPEVVSNATEKLAAAAGGPGQQRFKALQVVSKCWVSASAGLQCRACETQFAPLLPPPSAVATVACHDNRSSTRAGHQHASHTTPQTAATVGPQAPWVVHFSQLPNDSVYGAQQEHESPSAVRQLAQQLHLQLSPISEAFSQEQVAVAQGEHSPEWHSGGRSPAKRQREGAAAVLPAAPPAGSAGDMFQQPLPTTGGPAAAANSPWQQGARSSDKTPAAAPQQQTWQLSAGCDSHTHLQQQQHGQCTAAACTPAGGIDSAAGGSAWGAGLGAEPHVVSPKSRVRPPVLKLPLGANSINASNSQGCSDALRAPANSSTGWGHAAPHTAVQPPAYATPVQLNIPQQQQPQRHAQQQQQQGVSNQDPWAPEGSPLRGLKRVSTQGYSTLGAEAGASADRERRSTAESLQQHRELLQQQLQLTKQNLQQRQPERPAYQQKQQQHGDAQLGVAPSVSGSSNVSELIAALQRVTGDSRRATAETAPSTFTAAAPAGNTGTSPPSSHSLHRLGTSGNLSSRFDAAAVDAVDAAVGAQPRGGSNVPASNSSIESLLQSLRGISDTAVPQAPAAQPPAEAWSGGGPLPLLGVVPNWQQQKSFGTVGAAPQPECSSLAGKIAHEQLPPQQGRQPEAVYWGSAGGHSSTVHTVPGSSVTSFGGAGAPAEAAQSSSQGPPSPLDLNQLLSMLHRATVDSRRGTAETVVSGSSAVVGGSNAGTSVLQSALQDSRRTTAEAAACDDLCNVGSSSSNAGQAVHAAAAPAAAHAAYEVVEAAAVPLPMSQDAASVAAGGAAQSGPQLPQWAVEYGWGSGVAAPAQLRAHAPDGLQQAGGHAGVPSHQQNAQQHLPLKLQCTGVSQQEQGQQQKHASNAGGSGSSVADLIAALRRATGESRRNTWEAVPAAATAPSAAAAADSDDAAARGVDVDPSRRDAGRPQKPHLTLKLPSDNTAFDAKAQTQGQMQGPAGSVYPQTQRPEHAKGTLEGPDSRMGISGGAGNGSNAHACSSSNASGNGNGGSEGPEGIDGLLNALQCIAVANKLQEAAAMAPEVAVVAQCHVAALERQVDQMPGSEYAALVSKLSLELSELNKQGLQGLQQQQGPQQQQLGPEYVQHGTGGAVRQATGYGTAADTALAGAAGSGIAEGLATGAEGDVFGSMSSGSQGLQQLVAALRRVTAEKESTDSSSNAGPPHHTAPAGQDSLHSAEQRLSELHAQPQYGARHVPDAFDPGVPCTVRETSAVQANSADGNCGYGSCSSIEALLSALQATSSRQAQNFAATGAGSPEPAVMAGSSTGRQHKGPEQQQLLQEQMQQQQWSHTRNDQQESDHGVPAEPVSSNGTNVHDLLVALRRATESRRWEGAEAVPEPAVEPAVEPHGCSSSDGTKDSNNTSAEQQAKQLPHPTADRGQPRGSIPDSEASMPPREACLAAGACVDEAPGGVLGQKQPGSGLPGDAGCKADAVKSGLSADVLIASAPAHIQQQLRSGPAACAASNPYAMAGTPAAAADRSLTASAPQEPMQQSQQAGAAEMSSLSGSNARTGVTEKPGLVGGPAGEPDFTSMVVVFDSHVPQGTKAQLSEALAAQGATVLAGKPHLGCGANTVVAEPEIAGTLLPLLLDIVSPSWLAKALRKQQGYGQGQVLQQAVAVSPDVARAIGLQLQHSAAHAAGTASNSLRQISGSTGAAAGSGMGSDDRSGRGSPQEQLQQPQVPVLVVPQGYAVTCAGDSMPVVLEEVQSRCLQQQQSTMMPAVLLTDQLWSVGQHPRMVAEEELDAVVLPAWCSSTITLLLPQCSSSLLGHAAITCPASDSAQGLTCGDVLAAVHSFYQQDVLLQLEADVQACAAGNQGAEYHATAGAGAADQSAGQSASLRVGSDGVGAGSQVAGQQGGPGCLPGVVQVVKRLQLLGHRQMFEGLFRVTRDPCSSVYEVCLA